MHRLFLSIILLFILVSCAQLPKQQTQPTPDEQVLEQGLKLLATPDSNDKKAALQAFEKACTLGNNYGCHKIGIAYNNGLYGFDKDYERAKQWYLKAAEKGYAASQQNIANLYAHRLLPEMDDVEGYKWLLLAEKTTAECLSGSVEVKGSVSEAERRRLCSLASYGQGRIRSVFRKRMSVEQIQQAEQEAQKWRLQK
ncbi:tetratricopeptide repeat protein [Kaarinaea lacus]